MLPDGRRNPPRAPEDRGALTGHQRAGPGRGSAARSAARAAGRPRHRRSAERLDPDRRADLARRRGAAHAAQSPAADPPGAQRRDRQRRADAQQPRHRGALPRLRRALRSGLPGPPRSRDRSRRRRGARRAPRRRQPLRRRDPARAGEPGPTSTVRTNAYQRPERPVFSVKVESARVDGMVSPRPLFEIYVHSRKLEGIHLRGGRVARGGLRWSDRPRRLPHRDPGADEDPDGEERGHRPGRARRAGSCSRATCRRGPALDAYLVERYREFVSGLLDVTDNMVGGEVVHPPEVVRHDDDDPYLVVAADKGTAHLSDTANQVSAQYRLLAGRRVRVWRQQRLRPQEGRHHRARRVGVHPPPLPHARARRADAAVHRGGHRRHGRRRLRQRHAAQPHDPPGRGVQPSAHLPRPHPGPRAQLRRAGAAVQAAALVLARLRRRDDQRAAAGSSIAPRRPSRLEPRGARRCSASTTSRRAARK